MDGKQLKNSILQWAIQGKLVPQNPKDEPAQKLLERIAASRNGGVSPWSEAIGSSKNSKKSLSTSLRGAKATKQSKNPPSRIYRENGVWYEQVGTATPKDITDEIPFEIPETWAWCRLEHVCKDIADIDHKMPPVCENGVPYISPLNFKPNNEIDYDGAKKISVEDFKQLSRKCKPERGDIIFPRYGTIGVIRTVKTDIDFLVSYSCATIKPYKDYMNEGYICFLLQSSLIQKIEIPRYVNKTTQPNVGLQSIKKFLFALPPLAEQKRIVAKLEQVLPLAEEYGAAQEQLDKLNKELPEALKKSILQEAIQGKLVPHLKSDGQADEFLKKIAKEKESLINAGKIKKEKTSAPISDEEKPFDLPSGWSWIRLGDYCERVTDQVASGSFATLRENVKSLKTPNYAIMVKTADFSNNFSRNLTYTDKHGYEFLSNSNLFGGELILSNIGSIGKVFIVPQMDSPMTLAPNSVMLRLLDENCRDYLYYFLLSPFGYAELMSITSGTAMKKFNKTDLKTIVIPVPPLPEQKRIVKKIEELYKVIDSWH